MRHVYEVEIGHAGDATAFRSVNVLASSAETAISKAKAVQKREFRGRITSEVRSCTLIAANIIE